MHPAIASFSQTCGACPEQYEGVLKDGRFFYYRMRFNRAELGIGDTHEEAVYYRTPYSFESNNPYRGMFEDEAERDATFAILFPRAESGYLLRHG